MDNLTALISDILPKFESILKTEVLSADQADRVEDVIFQLEAILNWEPNDDDIIEHNSCGIVWHDGCR